MSILSKHHPGPARFGQILRSLMMIPIVFLFATQLAIADAPLKSRLELDADQASAVSQIQKRYRAEKRSIRQVLNRASRKLRQAKFANNNEAIVTLTEEVATKQQEMRVAILDEDNEIRQVLSDEQLSKFEDYIELRDNMVGSSRDVNVQ